MSDAADLEQCLLALGDEDRARRLEAHVALLRFGSAAVQPLAQVLDSGPLTARREAAWALAHMLDDAAGVRASIERAVDDDDAEVARWAREALRRLDDPEAARDAMRDTLSLLATQLGSGETGGNDGSH